jgi:hypothetical protein
MTFEQVAMFLCNDTAPEWAVQHLRERSHLVGSKVKGQADSVPLSYSDDVDRLLLESALDLQDWIPLYIDAAEEAGEDYPDCFDDIGSPLHELIEFLLTQVQLPRRGPKSDLRRHLCASVCLGIWEDFHGKPQPHSPRLWKACEAYWVACGHAGYESQHIKNWEDFLSPSNSPKIRLIRGRDAARRM